MHLIYRYIKWKFFQNKERMIYLKIMKKSQIAIISLSLMVMIAGYVNYKYNPEREENLGQSVFVSSKDGFMYSNIKPYEDNENQSKEEKLTQVNNLYKQKESNETMSNFRASRDNMFSKLEETYSKVIETSSTDVKQITDYQNKLNDLIENKYTIKIVEDLIKSKGIDDIVIIPTNENLNVIVSDDEEISSDKIAIIQKIIKDELKFPADKITINVP